LIDSEDERKKSKIKVNIKETPKPLKPQEVNDKKKDLTP
jgi:hypothetical protein